MKRTVGCYRDLRSALARLDRFAKDGGRGVTTEEIQPLNNLLKEWKEDYIKTHQRTSTTKNDKVDADNGSSSSSSTTTRSDKIISPYQMVKKLDAWKENSLYVQPDGHSYELILQAAAEAAAVSTEIDSTTDHHRHHRRHRNRRNGNGNKKLSSQQENLRVADELLHRLVQDSQVDFSMKPSAASFVKVMNAWAQSDIYDEESGSIDSSSMIERWIEQMNELNEDGWPDTKPSIVTYNVLLNSLAKSGDIERMEEILSQMIQGEIDGISPDTVSFTTLLKAYRNVGTTDAAEKAESLLLQMEELYDNGIYSVRPNAITYTTVIECYAKIQSRNAGEKAEDILRRLERRWSMNDTNNDTDIHVHVDQDVRPDVQAYNTVIAAYMNTDGPEKAENFLWSMLSLDDKIAVEPNNVSFNTVMTGYARRGDSEKAEAILMKMHQLHVGYELHTKPDTISYNIVLDALANAGKHSRNKQESQRIAQRGSDILAHMERLHEESSDENLKPNSRTYNTCINIYAKAGMIDEADALLQKFTEAASNVAGLSVVDGKPTVRTHNTLLSACMIRGQVAMAMSFWRRMKEDGILSDVVTYNTLLKCHVRALRRKNPVDQQRTVKSARSIMRELKQDQNVQPNQITYAAFIDVLLLNCEVETAQNDLFGLAKNSSSADGTMSRDSIPDRSVFHRILREYGRMKAPRKAEKLLHRMIDASIEYDAVELQPTIQTYNLILQAWAESGTIESGERCSMILRFIQDSLGDEMKANIESYTQTLLGWKNSRDLTALNEIDSLILEMVLTQDRSLLPNERCYDIWIDAISESNITNKRQKVQDALKSMKVHEFVPTGRLKKKIDDLLA